MNKSEPQLLRSRAELPPGLASLLPKLIAGEVPSSVRVLKKGFVFLADDLVIKFYPRTKKRFDWLRAPKALRAVRTHDRLLPVSSPRPIYWERVEHPQIESLLIYEFVEGPTLLDLWKREHQESRDALPKLFADLHATGLLLGDLHAKNLLWSGDGWCVIDLDGVRGGLHALRRQRITEVMWARLLFDFEKAPEAESLYRRYLDLAGQPWKADPSWQRILEDYDQILKVHLAYGIQPGE